MLFFAVVYSWGVTCCQKAGNGQCCRFLFYFFLAVAQIQDFIIFLLLVCKHCTRRRQAYCHTCFLFFYLLVGPFISLRFLLNLPLVFFPAFLSSAPTLLSVTTCHISCGDKTRAVKKQEHFFIPSLPHTHTLSLHVIQHSPVFACLHKVLHPEALACFSSPCWTWNTLRVIDGASCAGGIAFGWTELEHFTIYPQFTLPSAGSIFLTVAIALDRNACCCYKFKSIYILMRFYIYISSPRSRLMSSMSMWEYTHIPSPHTLVREGSALL